MKAKEFTIYMFFPGAVKKGFPNTGKQGKFGVKDAGKNEGKEDPPALKSGHFFISKRSRPEETVIELDKLFKKTKTVPCIYYLPISEEVAKERKKALK